MNIRFLSPARLAAVAISVFLLSTSSVFAQSGAQQSPIDLQTEAVVAQKLPKIHFSYGNDVTIHVVNTGSPDENATVRAEVPAGAASIEAEGVTYTLLQFHWHTPSEHRVNGVQYPLEMHFVHKAEDGTLMVVGVLIREGKENAELGKIFSHLPATATDTTDVSGFDLTSVFPAAKGGKMRSFRYPGSLTTPPFTEGVHWVVLETPIEMSPEQIDAFKAMFPEHNSREDQPINGRTVVTDKRRAN